MIMPRPRTPGCTRHALGLALVLVLAGARPAHATVMRDVPLELLVAESDVIVRATVERVGVRLDLGTGHAEPHTVVSLRVTEAIKGEVDERIVVDELGGTTPQGLGTWVEGTPRYRVGEDVVVFLDRTARGALRTYAMCQGHFEVRHGVGGAADVVVRDTSAVGLASWEHGAMTIEHGGVRAMPLDAFLGFVRDALSQTRLPGGPASSTATGGAR